MPSLPMASGYFCAISSHSIWETVSTRSARAITRGIMCLYQRTKSGEYPSGCDRNRKQWTTTTRRPQGVTETANNGRLQRDVCRETATLGQHSRGKIRDRHPLPTREEPAAPSMWRRTCGETLGTQDRSKDLLAESRQSTLGRIAGPQCSGVAFSTWH